MSKLAKALADVQPAGMGRPRKLDQLLDAEDRQMIVDKYVEGLSVRTIRQVLATAGLSISDGPVIQLLSDAGVYRGG